MSTDGAERPFVNETAHGRLSSSLERILESVAPDSWVAGGSNEDTVEFARQPRNHETLKEREQIYVNGGPVTEFIDTRALMTYGTGVEFTTQDDEITDAQGRTVDEWLATQFPNLDEHFIQRGIQTYWAGDAWPEIVETRNGEFSHVNLIDPTTVDVRWDEHGEITELRQIIVEDGKVKQQPLNTDVVGHYWFKKSTGGPLGESLVAQNIDEIKRFARNQAQRANAIKLHGSPHYHVKVGSDSQSISDKLLRKVRNRFSSTNTDEKTNWVTGGQIDISELDTPGFEGMSNITETDISMLASGFGIPIEWTNFGSDGLGSGQPAESRQTKFERQARAEQRRAAQQFIDSVVRTVLEDYSPFPRDIDVDLEFGDVVSDQQASAEWMRDFKSYLTPDEVREHLGVGPAPDDAELGPPEGTPDAEGQDIGGGAGLFSRTLRDQPARSLLHDAQSESELIQEELVFEDIFERVLWSDEGDRQLFEFDPEEVPEFAVERLREAIQAGALFSDFETISAAAASQVGDALLDSLETRHGWSINSLSNNLMEAVPGLDDKKKAEVIARTETASLVNTAREAGYEEQFDLDEERFKWVGPQNQRTTDACEWLKEQTNPDFGGEPVTLSRLKELVQEAPSHDDDMPDDMAREWTVHINERHTFVRVV